MFIITTDITPNYSNFFLCCNVAPLNGGYPSSRPGGSYLPPSNGGGFGNGGSPSSSYGAPPSPPSSSYGAPAAAPSSSYGAPSSGGNGGGFGNGIGGKT